MSPEKDRRGKGSRIPRQDQTLLGKKNCRWVSRRNLLRSWYSRLEEETTTERGGIKYLKKDKQFLPSRGKRRCFRRPLSLEAASTRRGRTGGSQGQDLFSGKGGVRYVYIGKTGHVCKESSSGTVSRDGKDKKRRTEKRKKGSPHVERGGQRAAVKKGPS